MCVNQDSKLYWLTRHRKQASESDASVLWFNRSICANYQIEGLVQDCSISSALVMEILRSYNKPSKLDVACGYVYNVCIWYAIHYHH